MTTRFELLKLLADGSFHSGTDLGRTLGVSRAAVCKNIRQLTQSGLEVHRISGRGYKLEAPLQLLDKRRILKHLGAQATEVRDRLQIVEEVDSTNRFLSEQATEEKTSNGFVCLAETQQAGRGRRGRTWVSTPYRNLMLSMTWSFQSGPGLVSGLSLAAGLAVLRALEEYGVKGAGLKWPNDLLWEDRKLAGLLADVQGEAAGPTRVILGVGVNAHISEGDAERIDQPWIDLRTITGEAPDRNRLAALLIKHLSRMFLLFADKGLSAFREDWERHHLYHGRRVRVLQGDKRLNGKVEGIEENGALRLRDEKGKILIFHSGEISVRAAG